MIRYQHLTITKQCDCQLIKTAKQCCKHKDRQYTAIFIYKTRKKIHFLHVLIMGLFCWFLNSKGGQDLRQARQVSGIWVPIPERDKENIVQVRSMDWLWPLILQLSQTSSLASLTLICLPVSWSCVGCRPRSPLHLSLCLSLWRWVPAWRLSPAWAAASLSADSLGSRLQIALP